MQEEAVGEFCEAATYGRGFAALQRLFATDLEAFLAKFVISGVDVDAVSQESWIKVMERRDAFCSDARKNFRAFLLKIAKNKALEELRKRRPGEFPPDFDIPDAIADPSAVTDFDGKVRIAHDGEKGAEFLMVVTDPDLKFCLDKLQEGSSAEFDALVSQVFGFEAELVVMDKHVIKSRKKFLAVRNRGRTMVKKCLDKRVS